ncbi:MAG: T9SS type A sorting domain-containing protein, partial [Bacteroidales bacterium]|nr:T9SS type A sorting domain-containing protein [Bacteroidales bacterium]
GLVGYNYYSTVSNSYSTGNINGTDNVGGLVGYNSSSTVSNSYSTGSISGTGKVGGLVGYNFLSTVSNSYSTGSVSGTSKVGGLVGYSYNYSTVSNSFYDTETSGQITSSGGTGKTTTEMKDYNTFTDVSTEGLTTAWDFVGNFNDDTGINDYWSIGSGNNGYLSFTWQDSLFSIASSDSITNINTTTATGNGNILYLGSSNPTAYGFCWNTIGNPDISGSTTNEGQVSSTVSFTTNITGLTIGEKYYSRAYTTNEYGTYYGKVLEFGAGGIGLVTTDSVFNTTISTAIGYGNITDLGTSNPTAYGFCWNTTGNPDTSDSKTDEGTTSSTGAFSTNITGLLLDTIYYVKAYVTNVNGTYYGDEIEIVTIFPYGSGTELDPYQIASLNNLQWLMENSAEWDKYYIQTTDINASITNVWADSSGFTPIGNNTTNFTGEYNGASHIIDSLYINRPKTSNIGLFGPINGAKIDSLGLTNMDITGKENVGGLVGYNINSTISNSYSTGSVSGSNDVGGLVGYNYKNSTISNSFSTGSVSGSITVGGLVGNNYQNSKVSNSYCTGSVTGTNYVGGLVGYNQFAVISNNYSAGSVTGSSYVGGLVGYNFNYSLIKNSYSTGSVTGSSYVGGLVGDNKYSSTISNSFYDTQTSGQTTSAGGTGKTTAEMKNYNTFTDVSTEGLTTAWDFVGNFNDDTETNDYWCIDGNDGYLIFTWQDSLFSIVLSNSITNITATTATGNGNILYLGSSNPTAYGFCWNTTGNPDTSDSKTNEGTASSTGTFSTNITGLLSNTIYYARAYVTNEYGTYYGKTLKYVFTALSGTGTSDDPYQIKSLGNLLWLMQSPAEWDKYYIQTADINAGATSGWDTGKGFIPIGNSTTEFTGEYNGAGHTIDSLFINSGTDNIGLFGYTNGSKIDSLGLTNVDITGKDNVGSFAGYTLSSTVSNSYSTGNISGSDYIGGLIGNNYYFSTINNSYNKVSVTGSSYIGGLVGYNYHHSTVSNSYSTGSVSGLSNVGGLIGVNEYLSTISNSFWDTETSGIDTSAGGIGKTTAEMKTFYNYVDGTEASWDFMGETINGTNDFWGMNPNENNGYPFLAWQGFRNTVCYGILTSSINETACFSYTVPSGDETHILSGVYMDTIPSINGCDSVITINLTIYTVDTSVTQTGATLTANAGSGAIYQWLNCNNLYAIIDGETNQSFTPIVNGNYAVEITEYGCTDTSSCYNVTVGIIERISNSFINIYPNPANSFIVVESKEINIESIEIINITGKVVKQIIVDGNKATIDLSDKTKGLYMIRLITDKGIIIKKVMLE